MIYVLIMLFGTNSYQGGHASVVAEFNSMPACHAALSKINAGHDGSTTVYKVGGCFAKGEIHP